MIVTIYPLYLYCNFSGYTDAAIGAARLFRMKLPENFNYPFFSENFISFWSRWHITLSTWLKTYVYNPLLMALFRRIESPRLEPYLGVFAFFVTFFLVGAWHGQTSEFLFFGVLQGGGVGANKLYQLGMAHLLGKKGYRSLCGNTFYKGLSRGLTFTWFAFTLLWFWSDWNAIGNFGASLGVTGIAIASIITVACAGVFLSAALTVHDFVEGQKLFSSRYARTAMTGTQAAFIAMVLLTNTPTPEIVYKAF